MTGGTVTVPTPTVGESQKLSSFFGFFSTHVLIPLRSLLRGEAGVHQPVAVQPQPRGDHGLLHPLRHGRLGQPLPDYEQGVLPQLQADSLLVHARSLYSDN